MTLSLIFSILVLHWIADFVCQTHWQSINKSTNNLALSNHVTVYSALWFVPMSYLLGDWILALEFVGITALFHFCTDYWTSKFNAYLYKKGDIHNFFVSIGFDQVLHYVQLFLTYEYLTNGQK